MSADEIHAQIRRPWASVPIAVLEDKRISLEARIIQAYLLDLGRRPNWRISVRQVMAALGITQWVWQRRRKELEATGYYSISRVRDEAGRLRWIHVVTDEPGSIDVSTIVGHANDGESADIHNTKVRNHKTHAIQPASHLGVLSPSPKLSKPPRAPRVVTKNSSIEELSTDPCVLATIGEVVEWLRSSPDTGNSRHMRSVAVANLRRRKVRIVAGLLEHILEEAQRRAMRLEEQSRDGKRRANDGDSAHIS